jgi:hypothetical protein
MHDGTADGNHLICECRVPDSTRLILFVIVPIHLFLNERQRQLFQVQVNQALGIVRI